MTKRRRNSARDYPRTARLNELLREVMAGVLESIDDDRIGFASISGVDVDNELSLAKVYISTLDDDPDELLEALDENRGRFRKAIGNEARLRRVPEITFHTDPAIQSGGRVEQILAELGFDDSDDDSTGGPA